MIPLCGISARPALELDFVCRETSLVKKIVILLLLIVVLLGETGGEAAAQELLVPDQTDNLGEEPSQSDLPPFLSEMPAAEGSENFNESLPIPDDGLGSLSPEQADDAGDLQLSPEPFPRDKDYHVLDRDPALLESSGTWLRRGFWYAEIDAVILNRKFNRDSIRLILQSTILPSTNPNFNNFTDKNELLIAGSKPGAETVPRVKLGRFLFRDHFNRDHTAEFIVYGGGQWSQDARLDANPNTAGDNSLVVPLTIDGGNASFDGATSSQFSFESRFNSFELNYHVKSRMQHDRMELEPGGHWVRRAQPSISRSFLAGVRYFNMTDNLNWTASGIPDANADNTTETGSYTVRTDNDMLGTQVGLTWNYETARWSLGASAKGGAFLNRADLTSNFIVSGGVTSGSVRDSEDNLSFLGEVALKGKWHLRPNLSLRTGLEMLYVTQTALAPDQLNFIPTGLSGVSATGDPVYLGVSIGFEGYW